VCLSKAEGAQGKLEMEACKPRKEKVSKAKTPEGQDSAPGQMGKE